MRWLALCALAATSAAFADEAPERLTLDDAVRIARANHPTVGGARAGVDAAAARVQQGWAPFFPGITGSFAYQPQTANFAASPAFARLFAGGGVSVGVTCRPGAPGCTAPAPCVVTLDPTTHQPLPGCERTSSTPGNSAEMFNFFTAQIGLAWTLFDFGHTYYGWRYARGARDAAREAVDGALLAITLDARVAFYGALAAEQLVAVAEESLATQTKHLDQMQGFVEVGTRTRVDLAQARADRASAKLQLARARGGRDAARAVLHAAMGLETWRPFTLVAPPDDSGADMTADPELAVLARPEVRQLELQARAVGDLERSVLGTYFPSLVLALGPSFAGTALDSLTPNFSASVTLGFPLFGGMNPFLVAGQVREQRANRAALLEQARVARNGIRLEAAQAAANLSSALQAVAASRELSEAATERRELANGRFEAGLGTVLDLSDAELSYVNARAQAVQAGLDLGVARARVDKAMGR